LGTHDSRLLAPSQKKKAYALAGVDVDLANKLKRGIGAFVRQTHGPHVLGKIGGSADYFARVFRNARPVLVASIDGVGTKLKIAFAMDKHERGHGSREPLCRRHCSSWRASTFFLDYIAARDSSLRVPGIASRLSRACRAADCALLGGETAQMPDVPQGESISQAASLASWIG